MQNYLLLGAGVACAAAGGELFVRSVIGLARTARIPGAIIGATVAAFATSSPEFAVATSAATQLKPQIALGDALGSNVVNVALILGLTLIVAPVSSPRGALTRDFPVALAVPAITAFFCLDGILSRIDAALLLGFFAAWLSWIVAEARRQRGTSPESAEPSPELQPAGLGLIAAGMIGLTLLFGAGQLIVAGASGIAASFGVTDFVIGATIVAAGTSAPELATALIAKMRGRDDIGLGTILGSNIFNGLWIVPVAALIHPITIEWRQLGAALAFSLLAMIVAFPPRSGLISRGRGAALLILYCIYTAAVLLV